MNPVPDYALDDQALLASCDLRRSLSSGPGGQHAQKTRSAVCLSHRPSGLRVHCEEERNATRNQARALARLRIRLACQQRGYADQQWITACRQGSRLRAAPGRPAYVLLVALILDVLEAEAGQLAACAQALATSSSQILRILQQDKEVWAATQALRQRHGLAALHSR